MRDPGFVIRDLKRVSRIAYLEARIPYPFTKICQDAPLGRAGLFTEQAFERSRYSFGNSQLVSPRSLQAR